MSALTPMIAIEQRPHNTMCFACGGEDGTVRAIVIGWSESANARRGRQGGSTSVALCAHCRQDLASVLAKEAA